MHVDTPGWQKYVDEVCYACCDSVWLCMQNTCALYICRFNVHVLGCSLWKGGLILGCLTAFSRRSYKSLKSLVLLNSSPSSPSFFSLPDVLNVSFSLQHKRLQSVRFISFLFDATLSFPTPPLATLPYLPSRKAEAVIRPNRITIPVHAPQKVVPWCPSNIRITNNIQEVVTQWKCTPVSGLHNILLHSTTFLEGNFEVPVHGLYLFLPFPYMIF